ncbi:MAG: hypothetical protein WD600_04950, partial [Pseudohongiella sp.]
KATLCWLMLTVVLSLAGAGVALWSAKTSLQDTLAEQLPRRLADALQFSFVSDADTINLVSNAVDQDLGSLSVAGRSALLHNCSAQLIRLLSSAPQRTTTRSARLLPVATTIRVDWHHGQSPEVASFQLQCTLDVPRLLGINAFLALVSVLLMLLLPPVMSRRLPWLLLGIKQHGYSARGLRQALAIALAPATMRFDHQQHSVTLHGITLTLPKTPYFYYVWYARLRLGSARVSGASPGDNSEGWLLNPATDRPDRVSATFLIELMTACGGHQKAINDLTEHGLRAKILDQNRNKVKDELCRVLGETLAAPYLFESERDPRTARYRHRLACAANLIVL